METIIEKEKARQERYFIESKDRDTYIIGSAKKNCHKNSLINLKEYMEEVLIECNRIERIELELSSAGATEDLQNNALKNIEELTKLIEAYS